jgi:Luciferase-like monooxygenase
VSAFVRMNEFRFGLHVVAPSGRDEWVIVAGQAEDLGFSVLTVADHLIDGCISPFAVLGVAAEATSTLRLGTLVLNNDLLSLQGWMPIVAQWQCFERGVVTLGLLKRSGARASLHPGRRPDPPQNCTTVMQSAHLPLQLPTADGATQSTHPLHDLPSAFVTVGRRRGRFSAFDDAGADLHKYRTDRLARDPPLRSHFSEPESSDQPFSARGLGETRMDTTRGRSMSTHAATGFTWAEAMQPLEDRRERARVVASFAEYLAEDVHGDPDRALDAMASLAEWSDGDTELLAQARADVLRDTHRRRRLSLGTTREAVELLELVASAS